MPKPSLANAALSHEAQVLMDAGVDALTEAMAYLAEQVRKTRAKRDATVPGTPEAIAYEFACAMIEARWMGVRDYRQRLETATRLNRVMVETLNLLADMTPSTAVDGNGHRG